ncbi:MAG: master DNA invertase Mpi family serine-type recombinase [Deltaproteobacteria bacterium]|jgi:DNA invertase Pin-like site-specific DNA recombinase|nr:master DNA invertase Mpi family serine-type recombinase [Deltaproteobacteria bacterium]
MIYGYIRVSTATQTTENQRFEIEQFVAGQHIVIDEWVEETISSRQELKKRKLGRLIRKIKKDDIVISSELSRLGRDLLQIMGILNHCMNIGANIWTIRDNYRLDAGIQGKILAFAFGLTAELERNLISQRTKEALAARRAAGQILGRPFGSKSSYLKLTGKENSVRRMLARGDSKTAIARKLRVNRETLTNFIRVKNINL